MDIAYLARGSVDSPANIAKTKNYLKKGMQNQLDNKGFSLIEILSPCPTNWNLTPVKALERIKDTVIDVFPWANSKGGVGNATKNYLFRIRRTRRSDHGFALAYSLHKDGKKITW